MQCLSFAEVQAQATPEGGRSGVGERQTGQMEGHHAQETTVLVEDSQGHLALTPTPSPAYPGWLMSCITHPFHGTYLFGQTPVEISR